LKILHLDQNHPLLIEQLEEAGFSNDQDYTSSKKEVEQKISSYHGLVIRSRFQIDQSFIDAAKRLKFIARVGAGLESIDIEYAKSKGILLISAPEGNKNAVGEHTLGMLLSLFNKLNTSSLEVKLGYWNRESNRGLEVEGKTIALIGYGNMGKSFAKKLKGFNCTVFCYDIKEGVGNKNAIQVKMETIFETADIVSLHTPWTPLTDKMINTSFINSFKKPFWLLNTARGKSVVTSDLVTALKNGKILGAGLDVLEYEKESFESLFTSKIPIQFKELLAMDNVVLSPHVAGWTLESKVKLAQIIVDKIVTHFGKNIQ